MYTRMHTTHLKPAKKQALGVPGPSCALLHENHKHIDSVHEHEDDAQDAHCIHEEVVIGGLRDLSALKRKSQTVLSTTA